MNKIVIKTSLVTLAAIALAALLVFSLWILCSPQSMASSCEKTGNYSFAVTCADLRYKYTKNVADLARCAEDSILSGKDGLIVKYTEKLIEDEGFDSLCAKKDEQLSETTYGKFTLNYKGYVLANLAAAQYRCGDLDKAVSSAEKAGVQGFTKLVIAIVEAKDGAASAKVKEVLQTLENSENLLAILENTGE